MCLVDCPWYLATETVIFDRLLLVEIKFDDYNIKIKNSSKRYTL